MRVLTLGTFDLLHPGHLGLFATCRKLAGTDGQVIVAVNTDEFVTRYKGRPPADDYTTRTRKITDHGHQVIPNTGENQWGLILTTAPDLILVGDDWATKDYHAQLGTTQTAFDQQHITLAYVPRHGPWSSTALRANPTRAIF